MVELRALLFDLDGTLADTEGDGHRPAFNAAFAAAGLGWEWTEPLYQALLAVTGGRERIRHYLDLHRPPLPPQADLDALVADLHRYKTRLFQQWVEAGDIPLRPGVKRLIGEARAAGLALGIATTTSRGNVEAVLRRGLGPESLDWFAVLATGESVERKKPAPDVYLWALQALGLEPNQCLVVEDSAIGVRAAWEAGIRAILVTPSPYTQGEDFSVAPLVVDCLGDPGRPCRVLKGPSLDRDQVDVPLLRRLHQGVSR